MPDGAENINPHTMEGGAGFFRVDAGLPFKAGAFGAEGAVTEGQSQVVASEEGFPFNGKGDLLGRFFVGRVDNDPPLVFGKHFLVLPRFE